MPRFIPIILVLILFGWIISKGNLLRTGEEEGRKGTQEVVSQKDKPLGNVFNLRYKTIDLEEDGKTITVSWVIASPGNVSLYPNFSEKLTSRDAKGEKNCSSLVNAGFYTKERTPIGLFVSEGRTINPFSRNRLFNGVFSIDDNGIAQITPSSPQGKITSAAQTGPVLLEEDKVQNLSGNLGDKERRMAAGITKNKEIIFATFFQKDSAYLGPTLERLPSMLLELEKKTGVDITDAINLDGGTASAFLTEDISLGELTLIGGYFCIK